MATAFRPLPVFTRPTTFGFGWHVFRSAGTFDGLIQLEITCGGTLKAIWEQNEEAVTYNLYVRANDDDVFQPQYLLGKFREEFSEVKFRTLADGKTLLNSMDMVFVGLKAEGPFGPEGEIEEDSNTIVLNVRPQSIGVETFIDDRHITPLF